MWTDLREAKKLLSETLKKYSSFDFIMKSSFTQESILTFDWLRFPYSIS